MEKKLQKRSRMMCGRNEVTQQNDAGKKLQKRSRMMWRRNCRNAAE